VARLRCEEPPNAEFAHWLEHQGCRIALVFLALVGLNASVYGINLIKYRSLVPACTQLLSEEDCMHYPIYAGTRNLVWSTN